MGVVVRATSAANRFSLGARPGELASIRDPRAWLLGQLAPRVALRQVPRFRGLPTSTEYLRREAVFHREQQQRKQSPKGKPGPPRNFQQVFGQPMLAELHARNDVAVVSERGFIERLVRFWSNHFAISVDKQSAALFAAPMEREAIRPHVLGRFEHLLLAVETHPGMLRYLDNEKSIGDNSPFASMQGRRVGVVKPGINENLAREILELHTLGVDGGYRQADIVELARAITGWTMLAAGDFTAAGKAGRALPPHGFVFRAGMHEPGARSVAGRRYPEGGVEQGRSILTDLALHPSTARFLSTKLARHFVSDQPPPALIARMTAAWLASGGELAQVYRAMVESDLAWGEDARKFKTPDDLLLSILRAGQVAGQVPMQQQAHLLQRMGQPLFMPRSPKGFADTAADWTAPDALWKRVQSAMVLARHVPAKRLDPLRVAGNVFGITLDVGTAAAVGRAESPREGLTLLFASPAFQWRA